ncbi:hypothetical protein BA768_09010 [Chryseobacterium sp. CBo1]|uniref:hypothetical protein n=1 Tax=Chryseobacterium sp. CBo1 TaxID=1869230 RepID=UPI000810AED7|nr:hypothetical protein [Chryseobacterium sp. CBo1]OCK49493.1 hypothetical protein BA768_09010 [Chryseobacterium sp. CBo1]
MKDYTTEKYKITIYSELTFTELSVDNIINYDFIYFEKSEYKFSSIFGIRVYNKDALIKSAVIGSDGGETGLHDTSTIIEDDKILICCSDSIFCLSIPYLNLLWQTKADPATCFEIYKYKESYIIHGELQISRLDNDGKILWQQGGQDIFTTPDSENDFLIKDDYIEVTDWENRVYKFDFDGQII